MCRGGGSRLQAVGGHQEGNEKSGVAMQINNYVVSQWRSVVSPDHLSVNFN